MYFVFLQEDVFLVKAVELGRLKKVKIRHDNKGFGAAWFLGHVEIEDPKTREQSVLLTLILLDPYRV